MAKPIERTFDTMPEILKFFDYKGAACVVDESFYGVATVDGRKFVKAGTPYPANDATCLGYILETVEVTNGAVPATYIFEGSVDAEKLKASTTVIPTELAQGATPRVTFFGELA